jgi:hypothetical protein
MKTALNAKKMARTGVFIFSNRKPFPCSLKRVTGEFERPLFSEVPIFIFTDPYMRNIRILIV